MSGLAPPADNPAAIDAAVPGDLIIVAPGAYRETQSLDRGHERHAFQCGKPSLEDFLHGLVNQQRFGFLPLTDAALLQALEPVVASLKVRQQSSA